MNNCRLVAEIEAEIYDGESLLQKIHLKSVVDLRLSYWQLKLKK